MLRPQTSARLASVAVILSMALFASGQSHPASPSVVIPGDGNPSTKLATQASSTSGTSSAAAPPTWAKTYGGDGNYVPLAVTAGHDGTYVVVGATSALTGLWADAWAMDISAAGDILWQKSYPIPDVYSADFRSVVPTPDGGYLVVGSINCFAGASSVWALKIDASGNIVWQKTYHTGLVNCGFSVHDSLDGGYFIAAYSDGHAWVLKIDADGNIIWQKRYSGNNTDYALSVMTTADGGLVVMGETASFGAGAFDIWVLRLDAIGNLIWQKTYGGSGDDFPHGLVATSDGGYLIAATTYSFGTGDDDAYLVRLDKSGDLIWQKTYGGPGNDEVFAMVAAGDGGFVFTGSTQSTVPPSTTFPIHGIWLTKVDSSGSIVWQKSYVGMTGRGLITTTDGGFLLVGGTQGAGPLGITVLKTDANGEIPLNACAVGGSSTVSQMGIGTTASTSATVTDTTAMPITSTATIRPTAAQATLMRACRQSFPFVQR